MIKFKTFPWLDIHFDDYDTEEGEKRLYLTPKGKFPSVTTILGILDDGKGLEDWIKRVGEEEAHKIVTEAGARGNSLHDLSELYLNNKLTRKDIKGPGKILFNRVKRFLDDIEVVIATEVALYSESMQYAGRVDCICYQFGEITILDHKNTRNEINISLHWNRKKLFKYMLQTAAYGKALEEMKGIKATKGCLVIGNHLKSTSERKIFDLEPLYKELDIILRSYMTDDKDLLKTSMYYKL